jgi:hypothetical protein
MRMKFVAMMRVKSCDFISRQSKMDSRGFLYDTLRARVNRVSVSSMLNLSCVQIVALLTDKYNMTYAIIENAV